MTSDATNEQKVHTEQTGSHELLDQEQAANERAEEAAGQASHANSSNLLDDAEAQLEKALAEVSQIRDQMLREQAETQNYRKRVQRDVENARKFALEKFVGELLPLVDSLEKAIASSPGDESVKPLLEGIELTHKSFLGVLAKFNVEVLNPLGEPFDPQLHEAMAIVPNPAMEPNSVMDVMQKGYTLNGRLVRAARVVVTKAP